MDGEQLATKLAGRFIVFDGLDGCGKSTQCKLLGEFLSGAGGNVKLCRDPGGTQIGDRIRHVLLDFDLSQMDPRCETLLFMASRTQLVGQIIEPALQEKNIVLCDRYVSSTCAYQGAAGYDVRQVIELGRLAVGSTWPDLTLVFDITVDESFARTNRKPRPSVAVGQTHMFSGTHTDAMEARPREFHEKVRNILLSLPEFYPAPVRVIDGSLNPQQVRQEVIEAINRELV